MAAGSTYTPIATTTLGSAQSSVTFNSFSGYTDLVLVSANITTSSAGGFVAMRFNGDTASNYSNTYLTGNGSTASSGRNAGTVMYIIGDTDSTNATMGISNLMNYSNSSTYKTVLSRCGYAASTTQALVHLWRSAAAVTSFTLTCNANFNAGCTFTLYGIQAA